MIFFKNLRKELRSQKNIMLAKEDIRILGEKINKETAFLETEEEQTMYHLTPYDLGMLVTLEPRVSMSAEEYYANAGIYDNVRKFECISFSTSVTGCLFRLPLDKLLNHTEFYIYRSKVPIKGWYDVLDLSDFSYHNEYRVFKETECIRLGKVITKIHPLIMTEKLRHTEEENLYKVIKNDIEIIKDSFLIQLKE